MGRTAHTQIQTPRLGSEDPFHPDLYARVQNFKSDLIRAVSGGDVWRGRGSWSTNAKHQRVTVKIRYRSDASGADSYVRYMFKERKGLDGGTPEAWGAKESGFDAPARVRGWMREGDERWFKIVFSPERAFGDVEGMVKHSMARAEEHLGTSLEWFASRHYDGGKDHIHVFLRGRDDDGKPLAIDKRYIKFGFRDSAQRYVTYHPKFGLGERSEREIAEGKQRAAEIVERRNGIRDLVTEVRRDGLIEREHHDRLIKIVRNASPKFLDEIRSNMQKMLDSGDHVWRERGVSVDRHGPDLSASSNRVHREPATRDVVGQEIAKAERDGRLDALEADRFRESLKRGVAEDVRGEMDAVLKVKAEADRNVGRSQDAERVKRRGGLSL